MKILRKTTSGWVARAGALTGLVAAALVVLPATPAQALGNVSVSVTVPATSVVGDAPVAASLTVTNTSTPPDSTYNMTVNEITVTPSCGTQPSTATGCSQPDLGVYAVSNGTGEAGTACAGVSFFAEPPDATGAVEFVPVAPVVLGPPTSGSDTDACRISFTLKALKRPGIDSNPGMPGVQTWFQGRVEATVNSLVVQSAATVQTTVVQPFQPDALIKKATEDVYIGDFIYNLTGAQQTRSARSEPGTSKVFHIKIQNDGPGDDTFSIDGAPGSPGFRITYKQGSLTGLNITEQVVGGTYSTGTLAPGASKRIVLKVKVTSVSTPGDVYVGLVEATSSEDPERSDAVKAKVTAL